jgi:hypothetical protein
MLPVAPVRSRLSLWLPLIVAVYAAMLCVLMQQSFHRDMPDLRYFWTAGRAVLTGGNPYQAVRDLHTGYPLFYPMPAALVMAPLALLPWRAAWVLWAALSGAALTVASQRYGRGLGAALLSACFLNALAEGTWSPILVAGAVLPALSPLLVTKPSIGAALWTLYRPRWAVVGGLGLVVLSFVFLPSWPREWWQSIHASNHVAPVLRPWGWLLLLALLRWRTPEGRVLLLLALLPQTASLYEALPLFLLPRTRREGYLLAVASFVAAALWEVRVIGTTIESRGASGWPALLLGLWLPALVLVLRAPSVRASERTAPE